MKIYILPINKKFQPRHQQNIYPAHNQDFGVEQDFFKYLQDNPHLNTSDPQSADWHYLPIYWTRWHVNHDYAEIGMDELQKQVNLSLIKPKKTFTICQYDDGPLVNTHGMNLMLASRKSIKGIDIPLLSSSHKLPWLKPQKKYLASFIGRLSNHPIRTRMSQVLSSIPLIYIKDGNMGTKAYVRNILESYVALCPRGYGGSSFRFFEAMQIGVVPFLIGNYDIRPFKTSINWSKISFFAKDPLGIVPKLSKYSPEELVNMGKQAKIVWETQLKYQKWCNLALKELK